MIVGKNGQCFDYALCDDQTIKRIAMMQRQCFDDSEMVEADVQ